MSADDTGTDTGNGGDTRNTNLEKGHGTDGYAWCPLCDQDVSGPCLRKHIAKCDGSGDCQYGTPNGHTREHTGRPGTRRCPVCEAPINAPFYDRHCATCEPDDHSMYGVEDPIDDADTDTDTE